MTIPSIFVGVHLVSAGAYLGAGYIGGDLPFSDQGSPDGRAKVKNVPSRIKIVLFDSARLVPIQSVISALDGSWRIHNLDVDRTYFVVGFDRLGRHNAAIQDHVSPHVQEP